MMIWRGWGVLGVLLLIGGGALGTAVAKGGLGMGVGIILGAVACWFVGQQLNVERPKALVAQYAQQRGAELHTLADAGTFHLGPGYAPPTSLAEAHQQADQLLGPKSRPSPRLGVTPTPLRHSASVLGHRGRPGRGDCHRVDVPAPLGRRRFGLACTPRD